MGASPLLENMRLNRPFTLVFGSNGFSKPSGVGGGEVGPLTGDEAPFWGVTRGDLAGASWDLREEGFELATEAGLESTGAVGIFVGGTLGAELMRNKATARRGAGESGKNEGQVCSAQVSAVVCMLLFVSSVVGLTKKCDGG